MAFKRKYIGPFIQRRMEKLNLTINDLADLASIPYMTLVGVIQKNQKPSEKQIQRLAMALKVCQGEINRCKSAQEDQILERINQYPAHLWEGRK